jgi:hypothetical protein
LCQIWCQDSRCGGKASSQYELQVHFDISLRVSWQSVHEVILCTRRTAWKCWKPWC